jgi:hypothetical protein
VGRRLPLGAVLALLLLSPLAATAGPDQPPPTGDAITRFLSERGLLNPTALKQSPLVQQVRDRASDLVMSAMNFIGVRYRWGGTSVDEGFDCSGFTRHVFDSSIGLLLPRRAEEQAHDPSLLPVSREELKPGDLVFFNTLRRAFSHVGIYIGEGKFIHAPRTGAEVRIEDMRQAYWAHRFAGARRSPLVSQPVTAVVPASVAAAVSPLNAAVSNGAPAAIGASVVPPQLAAAQQVGSAGVSLPAIAPAAPVRAAAPAPLEAPIGLQLQHIAPPLHADGH